MKGGRGLKAENPKDQLGLLVLVKAVPKNLCGYIVLLVNIFKLEV